MKRPQIYLGTAVLLFALLLAVQGIRATESPEVDSTINPVEEPFSQTGHVSLRVPLQSDEDFSFGAVSESPDADIGRSTQGGAESASELNRKLTNPVSDIWSIANQFNNFELNNGHWNNNWNFQPVLPVGLTKDWNLITRPVMPFYDIVPHETAPNEFERAAGLGDLALLELLS